MKEKTEKLISRIILQLSWGVAVSAILPITVMWFTTIFYLQRIFTEEGIMFEGWVWQVLMLSFVCLIFVFMILSFSAVEGFHKGCCEFYYKVSRYLKKEGR